MANKVMIIGTGNVGASIGFSLVSQRTAVNELVLIDLNQDDAEGEAMDLRDTLAVSPTYLKISAGSYKKDAKDTDIVIFTAGAAQKKGGETRMELLACNAKILHSVIDQLLAANFHGIFLIVTNPVDVMSYLAMQYSGFPSHKVIGSGTVLDSARLRYHLAEKLKVSPKSVHAYQVGEHGDSEFTIWSSANVGGQPVQKILKKADLSTIEEETKTAAYKIIERKGATYYGIGACVTSIVNCIFNDECRVLPVSTYDAFSDTYFGFPVVVGRKGIIHRLDTELTEAESLKLQSSINVIKKAINTIPTFSS
ncbi:MAG: L-lactate dehydrogenase [Candidatus Nanosynbacter sp.]|nr:L-lactate dehydrogenase [Candidatus Nanosynbacter sp.]